MTFTRRRLFGMLLAAPVAAAFAPQVLKWKSKIWFTRVEAKALTFSQMYGMGPIPMKKMMARIRITEEVWEDLKRGRGDYHQFVANELNGIAQDIRQRDHTLLIGSATGTVPARGHDGRHT